MTVPHKEIWEMSVPHKDSRSQPNPDPSRTGKWDSRPGKAWTSSFLEGGILKCFKLKCVPMYPNAGNGRDVNELYHHEFHSMFLAIPTLYVRARAWRVLTLITAALWDSLSVSCVRVRSNELFWRPGLEPFSSVETLLICGSPGDLFNPRSTVETLLVCGSPGDLLRAIANTYDPPSANIRPEWSEIPPGFCHNVILARVSPYSARMKRQTPRMFVTMPICVYVSPYSTRVNPYLKRNTEQHIRNSIKVWLHLSLFITFEICGLT